MSNFKPINDIIQSIDFCRRAADLIAPNQTFARDKSKRVAEGDSVYFLISKQGLSTNKHAGGAKGLFTHFWSPPKIVGVFDENKTETFQIKSLFARVYVCVCVKGVYKCVWMCTKPQSDAC